MHARFWFLALALSVVAVGCSDDSPTTPSSTAPRFSAGLLPSNEVPAITNADSSGSGTVTVTVNATKDSGGNITSATADFVVTINGFPPNETITGAHIHTGTTGTNGGIVWNLALGAGEIVTNASGSATITKNGVVPADVATAQALINNPAAFYFNVHTTLNPGGAARGQLIRAN